MSCLIDINLVDFSEVIKLLGEIGNFDVIGTAARQLKLQHYRSVFGILCIGKEKERVKDRVVLEDAVAFDFQAVSVMLNQNWEHPMLLADIVYVLYTRKNSPVKLLDFGIKGGRIPRTATQEYVRRQLEEEYYNEMINSWDDD